jgi:SH3 domain protein
MMKNTLTALAVIGMGVGFLFGTATAATMYVTDVLRLSLRSAPGAGNKTVAVLKSGQILEVLETEEQWSHVRLPDGREGWVLSRYLTPERTAALKYEILQQQYTALKEQAAAWQTENETLKKQNQIFRAELEQTAKRAEDVGQSYDQLKKEAASYLKLKENYKSTTAKLADQQKKIAELEKELSKLETLRFVWWFLAGAGVLLVGFIAGFSIKRQRRRFLT